MARGTAQATLQHKTEQKCRAFYENECLQGNWSKRQLQRQIGSLLYERTGLSKKKHAVVSRAHRQEPQQTIEDLIRDPYVLEFTGLAESPEHHETELEKALLNHPQKFLLELGTGFCFEARQKRFTVGNEHNYLDLVFYQRRLRCHVLLDLKVRPFQHGDAGQMNFYVNRWKQNGMDKGDNPPVGIILCSDRDQTKVEFALGKDGTLDGSGMKRVDMRFLDELPEQFQVKPGDLLMGMSGSIGKLAINRSTNIYLLNQRVGRLEPILVEKQYLYYFLRTIEQKYLDISFGMAIKNLSTEQINETPFPLPLSPNNAASSPKSRNSWHSATNWKPAKPVGLPWSVRSPEKAKMNPRRVRHLAPAVAIAAAVLRMGVAATLEDASPQFRTNTAIVWQAPTNHLPAQFWIYKRLPQVFSAAAISNGIVLAGFEKKGFPQLSIKDVVLWADRVEGEPRPPCFAIHPKMGQMSFTLGDRAPNSPEGIAQNAEAVKQALRCASLLGVDLAELAPTNAASAGRYGVRLARQMDGVRFFDDTEGLQIQFGKDGKIRGFALSWPKLEREESCATATPAEIIRCIRARKAPVAPMENEGGYFARVKGLGRANKLTITQVRVYYSDGMFGELPPENEPAKQVTPAAELEALTDLGTNSVPVQLYTPILSADVRRVLGN